MPLVGFSPFERRRSPAGKPLVYQRTTVSTRSSIGQYAMSNFDQTKRRCYVDTAPTQPFVRGLFPHMKNVVDLFPFATTPDSIEDEFSWYVGQRVAVERGPLMGLHGVLIESHKHRLVISVTLPQRSVAVEAEHHG